PMDYEFITGVVPLGNINPPSHTFPTDHIYFYITRDEGADRPHTATLYSPGDMTVTGIVASEHVNAGFADYMVHMEPHPDITFMFYHVSTLSEEIFGDTSSFSTWKLDNEYETGGETYRSWSKALDIEVKAGDIIGTVGGNPGQWAMDIGMYDARRESGTAANPERWARSRYKHAVCPLDFYEEGPVLDKLLSLLTRDEMEGDGTPCGAVLQDIPGTAQGNWFLSGVKATYPEDRHLAMVRSNTHPGRAVFSVGKSVPGLESHNYQFLPRDSGTLNRDFKDVVPGGQIYSFQTDPFERARTYDGIIIVTMPDADTLWIEAIRGAGADSGDLNFSDNKAVFVR
ncbi:hypothetical protein ACFLUG_03915, partial [Chloroflexota bacterium]